MSTEKEMIRELQLGVAGLRAQLATSQREQLRRRPVKDLLAWIADLLLQLRLRPCKALHDRSDEQYYDLVDRIDELEERIAKLEAR